jgi:Tfp pilus assembly protein PilO
MPAEMKRTLIEMVARLSRETQLHLDERHYHFRINKVVVISISMLLMIIAAFNIYYVRILYENMSGIVNNMDSMHYNMRSVSRKMQRITDNVVSFDESMNHMVQINAHTGAMAKVLPSMSSSMQQMVGDMEGIDQGMGRMSQSMGNMSVRVGRMSGGVAIMRENVRQIARPMGAMNPFMP